MLKLKTVVGLIAFLVVPMMMVSEASFPDEWYFPSSRGGAGLRVLEGLEAPALKTSAWEGAATTLQACRGKVVVLDFWATWCGPCVVSIPKNIELVKAGNDADLVFIGIHSASGGWEKAPEMIRDLGINYPVALDADGETSKAYKVRAIPTYVVIDRAGVIRAAGLLPDRVKEVVQQLVAESGPETAATSSEFDDTWFYGGAGRPSAWQTQAGKPAKPIRASEWIGSPPETDAGMVQVLQFTRPELGIARDHLAALAGLARTYAPQGVQFAVVCDAKADWPLMKSHAADWAPGVPVGLDRPVLMNLLSDAHYAEAGSLTAELAAGGSADGFDAFADPNPGGGSLTARPNVTMITTIQGGVVVRQEPGQAPPVQVPPPTASGRTPGEPVPAQGIPAVREAGMTAKDYGVRMAPVTVVIDRSGRIRATGLKLDRLKAVLDKLLAESTPAPPPET